MMRLPPFRYRAPDSLQEACRILADDPDGTRILAGGTDLIPNLKRGHQQAGTLLALRRVRGLRERAGDGGSETRIGGLLTLAAIADEPTLAPYAGFVGAARSVASPLVRNMGTIGGNLCLDTRCTYYNQSAEWRQAIDYCMKEAGSVCWVAPGSPRCWAISASDTAPILIAMGARVVLHSVRGERAIALSGMYRDDGIRYLAKERDEILTDVLLPPVAGLRTTTWKLRRRGSIDFPVLVVGAAVRRDDRGRILEARLALGAVASAPLLVAEATTGLVGGPGDEASVLRIAAAAERLATPLDNTDFTLQWRRRMVRTYVEGALREVLGLPLRPRPPRENRSAIRV
jgi:4-hydroxybenzoyl-CoA reductase subunit beta